MDDLPFDWRHFEGDGRMTARILCLIILLLEICGLSLSITDRKWMILIFYTQLSNLVTTVSALLLLILAACVFCHRAFCRFICPLGAIYSLFNPIAFFGIKVDASKCTGCNACVHKCKMDVKKVCDRECIQCGECIGTCPEKAISYGAKIKPEKLSRPKDSE